MGRNELIQSLIDLGYVPEKANDLFNFYERKGDLDGLEDYIIAREAMATIL